MPHFIIHCSANVLEKISKKELMQKVYDAADSTKLFSKGDIKVRIQDFDEFLAGDGDDDFIHVFGNIMEGRSDGQKQELTSRIVSLLNDLLPDVPIISMNIRDFDKASYCNKSMV
ncbi:MAG: 5-carboxymethyl-2-hydroxymuconate Delta-isomerase [Bacteroidota bacterium]